MLPRSISFIITIALLVLGISACNVATPSETPVASVEVANTPVPTKTATPLPTETPLPPVIVLLSSAEADAALADQLQPVLTELAGQEGLRFQLRPDLPAADELGDVRLVVALPPYPDLQSLVTANPDTQFLAIGFAGLEPASNLSLIGLQPEKSDQIAFIAGYMAAVITTDWRVAVITQVDDAQGSAMSTAFANGVFYMCGLCRAAYPPFPTAGYPLYVELPLDADQADWQSTINYLEVWQVSTVFVQPAVATTGLLSALAQAEINIIGATSPPSGVRNHWVASIRPADPMQVIPALLPDLLAGEGGTVIESPLEIADVNPELLSPGRQKLVEEMMVDLFAGYIDTSVESANNP